MIQTPLFAIYWRKEPDGQFRMEVKYGGAMLLIAVFALGIVVGRGGILP